jgi:hypothetical protein
MTTDPGGSGGESPRPVLLARRTMKARHAGRCWLDGCAIVVGVRIGQLPSGRWATAACIIRANQHREGTTP